MHFLEANYLARQEYKERLRNLERQQRLQAARLQHGTDLKSYQKAAGWLGTQLVKWGAKLQSYGTTSPPHTIPTRIIDLRKT